MEIPTSAGAATAVGLPFTSTKHVRATPLDGILELVLGLITRVALFDTAPGSVAALGSKDLAVH
jgi:hypothetical protein